MSLSRNLRDFYSCVSTGAHEGKECITTVPSKYKLHSQATNFFGSSHLHVLASGIDELFILYIDLANIFMHMHMHFIVSQRPLIDVHFPYMETKMVQICILMALRYTR